MNAKIASGYIQKWFLTSSSAPVIENGKIIGFLDISHFAKLILESSKTISTEFKKPISEKIPKLLGIWLVDFINYKRRKQS